MGAEMRKLLITVTLALAVAFSALAQTAPTPDLSGTWVFNPTKSKLSKHTSTGSETIVIKCAGDSIHIATASDGKQSTEMYVVDGKEHVQINVQGGGQWYSKAQWKKSVLITEFAGRVKGIDGGDFEIMHVKVRWILSADGRVLTRQFEDPSQLLVYDKQ
jgi:hypothetical protein